MWPSQRVGSHGGMNQEDGTRSERERSDATVASRRETLRRLAAGMDGVAYPGTGRRSPERSSSALDDKTWSLVRLGALVASDAAPAAYRCGVEAALAAGASVDEVVGTLMAVAPCAGLARLVSAAPRVAHAAGYDLDSAFESLDAPGRYGTDLPR